MIGRLLLVAAVAACAAIGWIFRDTQVLLDQPGSDIDQAVYAHDDSPYTSMTWVGSPNGNYCQMRFFDKIEGGVCMHPSWAELVKLHDPRLAHLDPHAPEPPAPAAKSWPYDAPPDPGTLSNSAYVRLFPLAVLLNNDLVDAAGGDPRATQPHVLVVGLGSAAGIAVLAHHFPRIAITVVDIDAKVVDIVRAHYPLIHWLSEQRLPDGMPRLDFHIGDARQFIRAQGQQHARPYDAIILDAYTAGSTIPPHLMTREFFGECANVLTPHGILLANVIGCYGHLEDGQVVGDKHRVLGGAIRTFRAAGLTHVINFPIVYPWESPGSVAEHPDITRNNIVACSRDAIEPVPVDDHRWDRLNAFTLFPELPLHTWVLRGYQLSRNDEAHWATARMDAAAVEAYAPTFPGVLGTLTDTGGYKSYYKVDQANADLVRQAVKQYADAHLHGKVPLHWDESADVLMYTELDCVASARASFANSVAIAHDVSHHGGQALVGDIDWSDPHRASDGAIIADAPLFTDQRPNADILNH